MIFFLLNFFLFQSSYAQDCSISHSSTLSPTGFESQTIKSSQSFSYFDRGKPLENFKTQDQDGLGTCYANGLSAALKVSHPDHPNISFIHASFLGSQSRLNGSNRILIDDKKTIFNWGGTSCATFDALQNAGGACLAENSLIENDPSQSVLIQSIGGYLDYFNLNKDMNTAEFNEFFRNLLVQAESAKKSIQEKCLEEKKKGYAPSKIFRNVFNTTLMRTSESNCDADFKDAISSFLEDPIGEDADVLESKLSDEFTEKLRGLFKSKEIQVALNEFKIADENKDSDAKSRIGSLIFSKIESILKEKIKSENCIDEKIFPESYYEAISSEIYKEWKNVSGGCKEAKVEDVFKEISSDSESFQCLPDELRTVTSETYTNFETITSLLGENYLDKLSEISNLAPMDQLKSLLMPNCQNPKNLIPLDNLSCNFVDLTSFKSKVCKAPGDCEMVYDTENIKRRYQDKLFSALNSAKGVTISVCTSFMQNKTFQKTKQCEDNSNAIDGHVLHALSLTGYRCVNGKIQYQILNSWGKSCPKGLGDSVKNEYMECELDSEGNPSGRFWVDEEVLFDSTIEISSID